MKKQCEANLGTWKGLSEEKKKERAKAEEERAAAEQNEKDNDEVIYKLNLN